MTMNLKTVETISRGVMQSDAKAEGGRTNYLRALVKAVQAEVGEKGTAMKVQLAALKVVNDTFYEAVLGVAEEFVPKGTKDRSTVLHARANFARTAASVLRQAINGGVDVMALKADSVTKGLLRARAGPQGSRPKSVRVLRGSVSRRATAVIEALTGLATLDADAAKQELSALIDQLTTQLEAMEPPKRIGRPPKVLDIEHHATRPGVFRPSETQVLKAQARAQ